MNESFINESHQICKIITFAEFLFQISERLFDLCLLLKLRYRVDNAFRILKKFNHFLSFLHKQILLFLMKKYLPFFTISRRSWSRLELMAVLIQQQVDKEQQFMNIKHIPIPFDELQLFKDQEKYQSILIETLIYSTKVYIHQGNSKSKYVFVLTKRNLIAQDELKPKNKITMPINCILEIVKSQEHPELVLSTEENYDNLRISANNEQRSQHIISAIAFYFTYLTPSKKAIKVYTIKQNNLLYFERTSKEKRTGQKLSLDRYPFQNITYLQSKDSPDITGKLLIQKMQLVKLINSQNSHLAHLAKVNENEEYICHTLDKDQQLISAIKNHKNDESICKLLYGRNLQYKIQLFFEAMPSIRPNQIDLTDLFEQTYHLYDKVISYEKQLYLSPHMLCLEDEKSPKILLREFRYKQLRFDDLFQRFLYRKIKVQKNEVDSFINKMYNLGMLIYYFIFGRSLFEHDDLVISIYLKENLQKVNFPYHMKVILSKKLKMFIQSCLLGKFLNMEMMLDHPWVLQKQIHV